VQTGSGAALRARGSLSFAGKNPMVIRRNWNLR
jgi:hypothetical protein